MDEVLKRAQSVLGTLKAVQGILDDGIHDGMSAEAWAPVINNSIREAKDILGSLVEFKATMDELENFIQVFENYG